MSRSFDQGFQRAIKDGGKKQDNRLVNPVFTGTGKLVYETAIKGYYECYTSGNFSFNSAERYIIPNNVDVFLVGGGGGCGGNTAGTSSGSGVGGGGSGFTKVYKRAIDG